MMTKAHAKLDAFGVRLGAKIAGVHWKGAEVSGNNMQHSAEQPAGYYNYDTIVQKFKDNNADLTFTCLEMVNNFSSPEYSYAKDLVIKVADIAKAKGVNMFGENALSFSGDTSKYEQAAEHLFNRNFKGYTHLRMDTFVNSTGGATGDMNLVKSRIVLKPKAITFTVSGVPISSGDTVYVTGGNCSGCTDAIGWELGNWQGVTPYMSQMTGTGTAGQYRVTIYVHDNRIYEFKAVKRSSSGAITWEGGSNNSVNTASTAAANWTW
jgi:beta-amylase